MVTDIEVLRMAIEAGLTIETASIVFLGWQMFKMNKQLMNLISAHEKRITVLEVRKEHGE